jgi:hypothetical protein
MKFFGVRPSRPQQATHGRTLGVVPTPPGSRRFCARGRAHSGCLRLCRAEFYVVCGLIGEEFRRAPAELPLSTWMSMEYKGRE